MPDSFIFVIVFFNRPTASQIKVVEEDENECLR
jgi:hypothetical protein